MPRYDHKVDMLLLAMQGNNQTANGIISANINCQTVDGTDVLMYMGSSLLAFSANFVGEAPGML